MEWPKSGERLFKGDTDWQLNACINCYDHSLGEIASSYKEAAETLALAVGEGQSILDVVILPVVYLYRQYLELSIKDIIYYARCVEREGNGYPKHHDLRDLWAEAKRLLIKHYGNNIPKELVYIQPCIEEFHEHDPESFAFRYPTDKKGKQNLRNIKYINLRNLYDTMKRIGSFLDCISTDLSNKFQQEE